uniref:Uncharacterized protein n=1 Tax=Eragrostis tef TaxID=110835 RepID=J9QEZ0_ERATE|nr:hypothetical protein [Eragrostis tef]
MHPLCAPRLCFFLLLLLLPLAAGLQPQRPARHLERLDHASVSMARAPLVHPRRAAAPLRLHSRRARQPVPRQRPVPRPDLHPAPAGAGRLLGARVPVPRRQLPVRAHPSGAGQRARARPLRRAAGVGVEPVSPSCDGLRVLDLGGNRFSFVAAFRGLLSGPIPPESPRSCGRRTCRTNNLSGPGGIAIGVVCGQQQQPGAVRAGPPRRECVSTTRASLGGGASWAAAPAPSSCASATAAALSPPGEARREAARVRPLPAGHHAAPPPRRQSSGLDMTKDTACCCIFALLSFPFLLRVVRSGVAGHRHGLAQLACALAETTSQLWMPTRNTRDPLISAQHNIQSVSIQMLLTD